MRRLDRWQPTLLFVLALMAGPFPAQAQAPEAPAPASSSDSSSDSSSAAEATAELSPEDAAALQKVVELEQSLRYQTGTIAIGDGLATLALPESLRFLDPADTEKLLTQGWGNPEGGGTLGMILPSETSPFSQEGWGVIVTYDEEGYVSDEDADGIDYDALLEEMKASTEAENEERAEQGYARFELVGWAERPRYDKEAKKLYWAKELEFEGAPGNTLNYNVRVLGRRGVLVLNAVATMDQLELVKGAIPAVIEAASFDPGHRYADYQPGTDKVAAYGLAALVAGGIAAKSGMLTKLIALLLAGKKLAIPAVIALVAGVRGLLKRGKSNPSPPTA